MMFKSLYRRIALATVRPKPSKFTSVQKSEKLTSETASYASSSDLEIDETFKNLKKKNSFKRNSFFESSFFIILNIVLLVLLIILNAYKKLSAEADVKSKLTEEYARALEEFNVQKELNKKLTDENKYLNDQYDKTRENMLSNLNSSNKELESLLKKYDISKEIAGMNKYTGPGILVVIKDKPGISYDSSTSASEIVHDADLRFYVEFFKRMYADAISVNGERISPMSPLLCTGPSVLVNRVYHSSPFYIEAGMYSKERIINTLNQLSNEAIYKNMLERGLEITIEIQDSMSLLGIQDRVYIDRQVEKLEVINYEE